MRKFGNNEIFADCLSKYARKQPKRFLQFDSFHTPGGGDDVMRPDRNGDCLFWGGGWELMNGPNTVRVLIPVGTTPAKVARSLRKIASIIKNDGERIFREHLTDKCEHCDGTGIGDDSEMDLPF